MAKTIAQLHTEAQTIRDATVTGENTATRVGGTIDDVVDFVGDMNDAIFGVPTSTQRTDPPISSRFLNANKTRIRIQYACNTHGRLVTKYTQPNNMQLVEAIVVSSYNENTGILDSSNILTKYTMTLNTEIDVEWDFPTARYIVFNAYTGSTMTDAIFNDFVSGLSVVIYDINGVNGLEQRVDAAYLRCFGTNVQSLGAVGDGVTDDTQVLQDALDIGGDIYIPDGTYLISDSLKLYSNTHLRLGENAVIKRNSNTIKCILYTFYEASTTAYTGQHDITIEGGVLDLGTGYSQGGCGLGFVHSSNIVVRGVTIKNVNSGYHCIDMGGCQNVRIEDCLFTDIITTNTNAEMVQIDATGDYNAFPILNYPAGSPCYDNTPCKNMEISGCKFDCNTYSPAIGGHNTGAHSHINIHDNFIYGTGNTQVRGAIAFAGSSNATDMVYIHDNFIDDFYYGFQFAAHKNIWVKNNILNNITNLRNTDSTGNGTIESNYEINV